MNQDNSQAPMILKERAYSFEDVTNTEEHAELINGQLVIQNFTSVRHNHAVMEIASAIHAYIRAHHGSCRVFSENVGLYVDEGKNFFLPDVMVVCRPEIIDDKGVHGAPDFVAEVTSESTRIRDFNEKLFSYRDLGVREYWVVDLQKQFISVYLKENGFVPEPYIRPDRMKISLFDLEIDTGSFWNS